MGLQLMTSQMWTKITQFFGKSEPAPVAASSAPFDGASLLDQTCAKFNATHQRSIVSNHGEVQVTLIREDGTLSATGPTTADAVAAVILKAEKCWGDL